ncbi:MAG TPA: acetylornithine deacetylase [Rhodospirillaceae bacterium]|nr:acetylornithine deacetylase [Rhodospirillaceae bacterium]
MTAPIDLLERLIAFDSTSRRSNLDIIAFIRDSLEGLGAVCRLTHDDAGAKANLFATLGPTDRPGVMLSGHTDVVPVDGQAWSSDPFRLTERDGRLYGRGSADMKGFIALCLHAAGRYGSLRAADPLHFAFSFDEELGCIGVRRLIADLVTLPVRPRLCLVGEPTGMKVVAGHKTRRGFACQVHGRECHSALAEGVNAVEAAAQLVTHIGAIQRRLKQDGPFDHAYDPPYTTLHTGLIEGGRALNIVPADCRFQFEIRALPRQNPDVLEAEIRCHARDQLEPEMKARSPSAGFDIAVIDDTAGFDLPDDDPAVVFFSRLTGDNRTQRVSFGTEAGLFNKAGVPTVVCGPGFIEQAHKPDEFISREQLAMGEAFLDRLLEEL